MDKLLLEILCCPVTRVPVDLLPGNALATLNRGIDAGAVKDLAGNVLQQRLREALATRDGQLIYRVEDGIPVMLADQAIRVADLGEYATDSSGRGST